MRETGSPEHFSGAGVALAWVHLGAGLHSGCRAVSPGVPSLRADGIGPEVAGALRGGARRFGLLAGVLCVPIRHRVQLVTCRRPCVSSL